MARVINLRGRHRENGGRAPVGVVYIGGKATQGGWKLTASEWANPVRPGEALTREEAVSLYLTYLHCQRPELLARVRELDRADLGCWCVPALCHGDILKALAQEAGR